MYYTYSKDSDTQNINNIFGSENVVNYIEYYLKYCDGGVFGNNQIFLSDFRGRNMYKNAYIYDFYIHEDYKRIVDEASLRDGLAWRKLKKFQLLLSIINKSLRDVSSLKTKQELINEEVKGEIEKQQQFWMDLDGKLWKKHEIEAYKNKLRLQAIGPIASYNAVISQTQQKQQQTTEANNAKTTRAPRVWRGPCSLSPSSTLP